MIKRLTYIFLLICIFLISQVLSQPELDTTFGGTGGFTVPSPNSGRTNDLFIQPDGKILILGSCFNINAPFYHTFCITRLNDNGSIDNTFGTPFQPGYVLTRLINADSNLTSPSTGVATQNDNKIISVGYASISGITHPVFVRYFEDGTLDSDFGTKGILISQLRGRAFELVTLPDGKFLIVGSDETSNSNLFIAKYNSDGTHDSTFGNNGYAILDTPGSTSLGLDITIQPDGKILASGYMYTGVTGTSYYLLTRFNPDGTLDLTFDEDGYQTTNFELPSIVFGIPGFLSVALQSDGKILALGSENIVYRFNSDGSIDNGFGLNGSRQALFDGDGATDPYDLVVTDSGRITIVGYRTLPHTQRFPNFTPKYRVARYLQDGSPDLSFSKDGFLDFSPPGSGASGATSAIIDSQGKVVLGGLSGGQILFGNWQTPSFSIARLLSSPIQNVGFSGKVVNPNGRPVANAIIQLENGNQEVKFARTNPFGYFRFFNVLSGQSYTISTLKKGLEFNEQSVVVDDEITNFLLIATQR